MMLAFVVLFGIYFFFPKPKKFVQNQYDAIVILGCPANKDGTISKRLQERCDCALTLYQKQVAPCIIVSGSNVKNKFSEAEVMKDYLLHKQPTLSILIEPQAKNTYQNFQYLKSSFSYTTMLIITSPSHIRRAYFFAKKFYEHADVIKCKSVDHLTFYVFEYTRLWICLYYEVKLRNK